MTGSHLFTLGLFQKNFNSASRVSGPAINMGCTRGRGSTTRMLNYCKKHSPTPSLCINQFITTRKPVPFTESNLSAFGDGLNDMVRAVSHDKVGNVYDVGSFTTADGNYANYTIREAIVDKDIDIVDIEIMNEDTDITNENIEYFQSVIDNEILPELSDIYLKKNNSEEWFDNNNI